MNKILPIILFTSLTVGCATNHKDNIVQPSSEAITQSKAAVKTHPKTSSRATSNVLLKNDRVVTSALQTQLQKWKGTPYRLGGNSLNGIDCSAFVQRTFTEKFQIDLPRTTVAQKNLGIQISREELKPGDLVFFKTNRGSNGLHVGIYNGNNQFIHASTSKGVMTSSMDNVYWKQRYYQARRLQNSPITIASRR